MKQYQIYTKWIQIQVHLDLKPHTFSGQNNIIGDRSLLYPHAGLS